MTKTKRKVTAKRSSSAKAVPQVEIKIPALSEYVGVVRLAISGIASRLEFSVEQVEDLKVAITEACANAVQYAYGKDSASKFVNILCKNHTDALEIIVKDEGCGFNPDNPPKPKKESAHNHLGLGITFMKTLMDEVEISSKKGEGTEVKMIKRLASSKPA